MRGPVIISACCHLLVIAVAWAGLPILFDRKNDEQERPVLVELVTVDDVTRGSPRRPVPAPEPPKPEPPKVEPPKAEAPPPPPAPPVPETRPQVAALPEPAPKPEPAPRVDPPKPEARPAPPPPVETRKPAAAVPLAKPTPPAKQPSFDPDKIALLIDRTRRKDAPAAEPAKQPAEAARPAEPPRPTNQSQQVGDRMTMSELDAIRLQIERCWNLPAGAREAQNMVVRVRFYLNRDGSLNRPPDILDESRMSDPFYRAMAESARRAVNICTPLKNLRPEKYEQWREITLTFNPKELLGG